jgi:hypothetical protein
MRIQMHLASSLLIGLTSVVAACGGDDGGECVGHGCEPGLSDPEGGNVIFEYIYFDTELQAAFSLPAGVTTATRIMGYYMSAHDPNANPLPMPGICNNLEATKGWPLYVAPTHTDLDIGTMTITGTKGDGTASTIDVPKLAAGTDQIGRPHNIFYQTVIPDAAKQQKLDSSYSVAFSGGSGAPAANMKDAIFLSSDFTVKNPGIEDNGPLVPGTDFKVEWNPTTSANLPEGDSVLGVTWLVDATGKPTHMCPVAHSAGTFTIPGSAITEFKMIAQARGVPTTKMILLRNAIVHKIQRLPTTDTANARRIDMLSVNCWAQLMNVQ